MKQNLFVFGCSFSSCDPRKISKNDVYGHILAKNNNMNLYNTSYVGNSNNVILYKLISMIDMINNDDIVIFQFTDFSRIHFFDKHSNTSFTTAALKLEHPDVGDHDTPFDKYNNEDNLTLVNYILKWHPYTYHYTSSMVVDLLDYLVKTKNIKYTILYMSDSYTSYKNELKLPIFGNNSNSNMIKYLTEHNLTVHDDFPESYPPWDSHPGISGHKKIAELIQNKLIDI